MRTILTALFAILLFVLGCWTPGDYRLQRQPEKIVFFDKTLSLREKWEMEEQWVVRDSKAQRATLRESVNPRQLYVPNAEPKTPNPEHE